MPVWTPLINIILSPCQFTPSETEKLSQSTSKSADQKRTKS